MNWCNETEKRVARRMGCIVWYNIVALFLFLAKSAHVSAQCTQPAVKDNMKLLDEYLLNTSFSDAAQVKYECNPGYVPVNMRASRNITCQGNQWSDLALECTRKSCGSPPDFSNGRYDIPQGILFGDTITGVCNEGYVLTSRISQRTCRSNGWDGRAPECEAVICLSPPIIENGRNDDQPDTQYEYGMVVSYRCNDGLTLIGSATLYCSQNGSFIPEAPKCISVSCEKPDVPHGYRYAGKAPPYTMNNFIDIKCNEGYEMKGDGHIVCTEKGWSPEPPQCIAYCTTPVFEGHVTISKPNDSKNKFLDGTNITFECQSGYKPTDVSASNQVTCKDTKWTKLELTCKEAFCGPPTFDGHVTISKPFDSTNKFLDGTNVTFECKSGYEAIDLKASKIVTCVDTKWTNLELKCKGFCGLPEFGENVKQATKLDTNKFPDGSTVEFECKSGYKAADLKASKFVTCMETKWTDLKLKCEDEAPASGWNKEHLVGVWVCLGLWLHRMGCNVWYNIVALFLFLAKSAHVSAQCTQPAIRDNMKLLDEYILTTSFSDAAQVKYECIPGYVPVNLRASRTITCQGNQWSDLALECTRKSCGSPPDFPNGRYDIPQGISFGDTITGVCNEGYMLTSRISQRTCRSNGWDGRAPECEAVICLSPPIIENGRNDDQPDTQYEYGMVVSYRCNDGLTLIGSATLHCSQDGTFSPEPPKCISVSCEKPDVLNGYRYAGKAPPYTMNNFIDYKCNEGYEMKGDGHIVCTEKGWSPEPPQCIAYCTTPVFEGHVTISKPNDSKNKFLDGTNITFECQSGYKPTDVSASNQVTCKDTKWTKLELTCKEAFCGPPTFDGHVTISKPFDSTNKFLDGTDVTFECKSGYKPTNVNASKQVTCKDTKWTKLELTCKEAFCGPPTFDGHVTISKPFDSTNKFLDGTNVTFECKSGYEAIDLKASKIVTCVDTKWTNLELKCKGFCGLPEFGENVKQATKLDTNKFPDGSTVEFECKSGYKAADLKASKFVTCMGTKWTDLKLKCEDESFDKTALGWSLGVLGLVAVLVAVACYFKKKNSKHEKVPTGNGEEDL
ncbi:regulator of complement activation group 2 gene 1 [Paramisgurnus dabryanus]|uniref:regulator of complement activation group 2 gene 1 n=1 Tax=Paramisgurnus dabryanus TaxID=90735 RepID=UPI003CCF2ABE